MKDGQTGDQTYHGTGTLLTMDLTEILWVCATYGCIVPGNVPTPLSPLSMETFITKNK